MDVVKLAVPLLAIYLLLRRKCNLGVAMVGGAVVLALLYAVRPERIMGIAWQALFSPGSVVLFGSFYVVMFLEHVLRVNGLLDRLMYASRLIIPDARVVMAMLPAFLGFLPSLGGALFSAPLVSKAAEGVAINAERKFLINYWYRHVWEYFLPIYPSLLLAQQILNVPMRDFITAGFIYTPLAMAVGFWLCFLGVPSMGVMRSEEKEPVSSAHYLDMFLALGPVAVILLLVVGFHFSVILATGGVLLVLLVWFRYNMKKLLAGVKDAFHVKTFSAVAGVLVFKEMLMQSGALQEIVVSITALSVPPVVMIGVMAFLISWITGMPQAAVGMVFPLIALLEPGYTSMAIVGIVCIVAGQMLSPMHLCLVVTKEYFQCRMGPAWRQVAKGEFVMVASAFIIYFLTH